MAPALGMTGLVATTNRFEPKIRIEASQRPWGTVRPEWHSSLNLRKRLKKALAITSIRDGIRRSHGFLVRIADGI